MEGLWGFARAVVAEQKSFRLVSVDLETDIPTGLDPGSENRLLSTALEQIQNGLLGDEREVRALFLPLIILFLVTISTH